MKTINPFILGRYESPEYFCDREEELNRIKSSVKNQRNLTIISHRRLGKTGLILHYFNSVKDQKEQNYLYLDLMFTNNAEDFIKAFARAVIGKFDSRTQRLLKSFSTIVKSLRPVLSVDPMTGEPTIDIVLREPVRKETTIEEIFLYLKSQDRKIVVALDEFQQISKYPEKNMEAMLRSYIQQMSNAVFIYSGSQRHMLLSMFGEYQRPFYQSSELLHLDKINRDKYAGFIRFHFEKRKRTVDPMALDTILQLSEGHTFYVQYLCNKLFGLEVKKITSDLVVSTLLNILKEQEVIYFNYRNLLTGHQFALLRAIAVESLVQRPTSTEFLNRYNLSAASTIAANLNALLEKEMIYQDEDGYKVVDVFFAQWLRRMN